MPSIGRGCHELRIVDQNVVWRLIYHLAADAVVILEVFNKKTRATPRTVITESKRRLARYYAALREE